MISYKGYTISIYDCDHLEFVSNRGEKKIVHVATSFDGCVYKLLKTRINAYDGVMGLYKFMDKAVSEDFMTVYVEKILLWVFAMMK